MGIHKEIISKMIHVDILGGIISSGWDNKIRITDLEAGIVLRTLGEREGHTKSVMSMDWDEPFKARHHHQP